MTGMMRGGSWHGVGGLALGGAAFCLSCWIVSSMGAAGGADAAPSLAELVFGETRAALGGQFHEVADLYFHRGVPHAPARAFEGGAFQRLGEAVAPTLHSHLGTADIGEMVPWLWMAMRLDPHNVECGLDTV